MKNAGTVDSFERDGSAARVSLFDDLKVESIGLVFEQQAHKEGFRFVAGVDEVGRGCLAGPVVAGACILDPEKPLPKGLDDSKKLTAEMRDEIAAQLKADCIAYAIGQIEADEIDRINILEATKQAMLKAIAALTPQADFLLIDALQLKMSPLPQRPIIKGDTISASIAAASILAKTYRDDLMKAYDIEYPQYGFAGHKGYGAAVHCTALREYGPCSLHRLTFNGVLDNKEENLPLF
ncbi:MAG: ribonuclease HII [Chloracidobacterium sp.]|nr:ribonuclease HII [Chloracidobacterium sp.]